jgi:hypothetical protein
MLRGIIAAAIVTGALLSAPPLRATEMGLIGVWSFAEGAGNVAADTSGHGNQGTLFAAGRSHAEWGTGEFAGALGLDGGWGAYVQVPPSGSLNSITGAITVAVLAYPRDIWEPGAKHTGFIALVQRQWREEKHPDQFFLGYGVHDNTLTYKWHVGLLGDEADFSLYSLPPDGASPVTGQWVVIAGTYDGATGQLALYVDGNLIGETTRKGSIRLDEESLKRPLAMGAELNQAKLEMTSGSFNGYLGEVRLYNRALSADEVADLSRTLLLASRQ